MKRREPLSIDLTPLVDVLFILLVFFIVTSVFKKEELALILDLPSSNAKEITIEQKQVTIELNSKSLAFEGKHLTFEALDIKLAQLKNNEKPIIIRIDKNVTYDKVVKVLNLLQQHNLNNLAMVTKE